MRKAWLIAWREIRWEIWGDRGSFLRQGVFFLVPLLLILTSRGEAPGPRLDRTIILLAAQSALLPAISGVALIASTFSQEKENGTLVPLLAAPIRDLDIVVGKLVGMLVPMTLLSVATLAVAYLASIWTFGARAVQHALTPELLYALVVVSFFYVLSTGAWVLVVAARVRSSRAAQQLSGILIAITLGAFATAGAVAATLWDGWGLLALAALIAVIDLVALELARRGWQRSEVIARL